MTRALVMTLLVTPLVYLLLALLLSWLPVKLTPVEGGLDFEVLSPAIAHQYPGTELFYVADDGSQLFYRYFQSTGNTILVLLHGSGTEGRYLTGLAQRLSADAGISAAVPDLRGHGRSTLSAPGDIAYMGQLEQDLDNLLYHLLGQYPKALMILGGHSSGGGLAVKYGGSIRASSIDGYLLLAPYLGYKAPTVRPNSGGWVQVSKRRYAELSMLNTIGIHDLNGLPVIFFKRPQQWRDALQVQSYSYRLNESFSPQHYVADLQANISPMLVLVGTDDDAFYADKFAPEFSRYAPQARVELVPAVRHLNITESDITFETVAQWLQSISNH